MVLREGVQKTLFFNNKSYMSFELKGGLGPANPETSGTKIPQWGPFKGPLELSVCFIPSGHLLPLVAFWLPRNAGG